MPAARRLVLHVATTVAFAAGSLLIAQPPAYAVAGALDRSFGSGGATFTLIGRHAEANAMAVRPDGKIVVAGVALTSSEDDSAAIGLARYWPNGRLDRTFGRWGVVIGRGGSPGGAHAMLLQPDGKIVVVGDNPIRRYLPDGRLDRGFAPPRRSDASTFAVALQPDGRIVTAGVRVEPGSPLVLVATDIVVERHRRDGGLDPTFADGGRYVMQVPGTIDWAFDVAVAPDGGIVVAGWTAPATGGFVGMNVQRLTPAGELDWSVMGEAWPRQLRDLSRHHEANAVVVRPDGRILVGGMALVERFYFRTVLMQLLPDGALDPEFGEGGVAVPFARTPHDDEAEDLVLRPNGDVVVVGSANSPESGGFVARIRPDGSVDTGFGKEGRNVTAFPGRHTFTSWSAAAAGPDGKITVAGRYCNWDRRQPCRIAVVRYLAR